MVPLVPAVQALLGRVLAAHGGGGDVHAFAVFGDGAAGDVYALLFEFVGDFLVAEGFGFVFFFDDGLEEGLYASGGLGFAVVVHESGGKEVFECEETLGGLHVFSAGGAGDGGFVYADDAGDVLEFEGADVFDAFVEEFALHVDDGFGYF